jgi:hypothetical protein
MGGVQRWILKITKKLVDKGYNVTIVDTTLGKNKEFSFEIDCKYFTLHHLNIIENIKKLKKITRNINIIYYDTGIAYYDFFITR